MQINFCALWQRLVAEFACGAYSVHGPDHWRRVERNGLLIAAQNGAVVEVVRLFALFHDCRRVNDGRDDRHGERGAAYAEELRGTLFDLPDAHFELLRLACASHTHGGISDDPTIGACWDADRLDIGRVGIRPCARYMSTAAARQIVEQSSVG